MLIVILIVVSLLGNLGGNHSVESVVHIIIIIIIIDKNFGIVMVFCYKDSYVGWNEGEDNTGIYSCSGSIAFESLTANMTQLTEISSREKFYRSW